MTKPSPDPQVFCCYRCEASVDPVRAVAKVIGARVVRVCPACSTLGRELSEPRASEPRASESRASSESPVPAASIDAMVDAPATAPLVPASPTTSHFLGVRVVLAGALMVATPLVALAFTQDPRAVEPPETEAEVRPATEILSLTIGPLELVEPAAALLASGETWVHPVVGAEEQVPSKLTRRFRAERPGDRPEECGGGHCGVDLDAPRGTPVVAIRDGIIEKVVNDSDAKGGRYVWIRHEDVGLQSEYFHFDRIAPDIVAGETVEAGQWLGTLGRTGIEHSLPHLHFTVRDVNRELRYLDPSPWLEEADILPLLDMRLADED